MRLTPITLLLIGLGIWVGCGVNEQRQLKANPPEIIRINREDTQQIIEGFGASDAWRTQFVGEYWPTEKKEAIADLLFSKEFDNKGNPVGIGLSVWRFYIGAGSKEQGEQSGIANEWRRAPSFLDSDGNWDWGKYKGQNWFLQAAKSRGVEQFLAFTISPPVHMTKNNKAYSPGGKSLNIKDRKLDDYVDFLVTIIEHFKQKGLVFDYLSPVNEPQWDWNEGSQEGTPALNAEIYDFIKLLSDQLDERSLSTRIVFGEAGDIRFLSGKQEKEKEKRDDQINVFFNPSSNLYIGNLPNTAHTISGHSYWSTWPIQKLISERKKLRNRIQTIDPELNYWQSEFCILQKNGDITSGGNRDLGIDTALYVARVIHFDLTIPNATSWQWWTALSQFNYKDGLIYLDAGADGVNSIDDPAMESLKYDGNYRDSKLLWALGNYSRFVRPGMKRVSVDNLSNPGLEYQAEHLMVSAYTDEQQGKLVLVFVNYDEKDRKVKLENLGINLTIGQNRFISYTTSETQTLDRGKMSADDIGIPARSVVTLTANLK